MFQKESNQIIKLLRDILESKKSTNRNLTDIMEGKSLWQILSREGKGFTVVSGFITIPTATETDFMLLRNPTGSNILSRLKEIFMTIGGTSAQRSIFRFYRTPVITAVGTPLSIFKVLSIGTLTSQLLAYQSPTISARGTLIQLFAVDFNTLSRDQDLGRYLTEGADLLITVQGSTSNLEHNISLVWAEETV